MNHKIGDKVIALNNPANLITAQPRIKGHIYTVKDIMYCSKCGLQAINLGNKLNSLHNFTDCSCGGSNLNNGLHWTTSKYFAPLQDIASEIEKAINEENYELADILTKNNNSI